MNLIEADEAARVGHQEKADELRKQAHEIYKVATSKEQLSRDDIRHQLSDLTGTAPDKVFDAVTGAGNDASASTRFNVVAAGIWSCNQGMMNRYSQLLEHQSQLDQQASRMQDLGKFLLRAAEQAEFELSRRNFLALVFCLMVGTAALPHVLIRYYTTPSVRQARASVTWSLLFIVLLYIAAPALAVLVKFEVFNVLVGSSFDALPAWVAAWNTVDPNLLSITDVNGDGVLQLNEMPIGADIIVLATAENAGLP